MRVAHAPIAGANDPAYPVSKDVYLADHVIDGIGFASGLAADGTTDDSDALEAALDALSSDHATLILPKGTIRVTRKITIPAYVGLVGQGRGRLSALSGTTILLDHADAYLEFVEPSWATIGWFTVNGGDVAERGIKAFQSNRSSWHDIEVTRVAGDAFRMHDVQNAHFESIEVSRSQRGLWVDDGTGMVSFVNIALNNNVEWQLKIGDSGEVPGGYHEPNGLTFVNSMFEWNAVPATEDAIATVVVEGVADATFVNGRFLNPSFWLSDVERPTFKVSQEGTADQSRMSFMDCSFMGEQEDSVAFSVTDFATLTFVGFNIIAGAKVGFALDGTLITIAGSLPAMQNVTAPFAYANGATYASKRTDMRDTIAVLNGRSFDDVVMRVVNQAEAGVRFNLQSTGRLAWGGGSNFSFDTNLYRAGSDRLKTDDKLLAGAGIGVGNSAAATGSVGSLARKIEVFDADGASIGFIPVYDAIT